MKKGSNDRGGASWGWLALWAGFVVYAARVAPPDDPGLTRALVRGTFTGDFGAVDASIAAVFCLLGVVPLLASAFILRDGAARRLPAWPFAFGAFFVGAYAILPWLALRSLGGPRLVPRAAGGVRRLLAGRFVRVAILPAIVSLVAWGAACGHPAVYAEAFRTTAMVHVMTIDLALCTALLFVFVEEARAKVSSEPALARRVRFVPLLGSALWNALVPRDP